MISGIYRIRNITNNDCYYGSSINIEKRRKDHFNKLENGTHINIILLRAWKKYGKENFVFEIVELCDPNSTKTNEQKYLDSSPKYNIGKRSSGGDNISKNPNKDKIIEKMRNSIKKMYSEMSDEEKKLKHSKPMESNPNWKGGISYKIYYCECGNEKSRNSSTCSKCRLRSDEKNPYFGKKHNHNTLEKLSETRMGKYHGTQNLPIIIDEVEYRSCGEASKILNMPMITIRWRVLSKNPKYKNYRYSNQEKESFTKEEQKERFSKPQTGKKMNHNKPFKIDGIEYRTLKEASELLKIHQMTIKGRLLSKKFPNYEYLQ